MTFDALISSLPLALRERVDGRAERSVREEGEFVLYWMRVAVRGHENPSLDVAISLAGNLGLPFFAYCEIREDHPFASDRHHTFALQGVRDAFAELSERGIGTLLHVERPGHEGSPLPALAARAAVVVMDDVPFSPGWERARALEGETGAPLLAVESAAVCPASAVPGVPESLEEFKKSAVPFYSRGVPAAWGELTPTAPMFEPGELPFEPVDPAAVDIPALVAACRIDHGVGPVPGTPGGSRAGYERWNDFLHRRLEDYSRRRRNPVQGGVSRMSPYLRHGHVSPFRLAREAGRKGGEGASAFLENLLVRRDLAHALCRRRPGRPTVDLLPPWVRETLSEHADDPRERLMSWERLAGARTGDDLWDLAQRSLVAHGELHDHVRTTWGRAILRWTRDPRAALETVLDLNDRFALDGGGCEAVQGALAALGMFDTPSASERPILGHVPARDTEWQSTMLDVPGFRRLASRPPIAAVPRVVVVGAGVAGLSCARVLRSHNVPLVVVEKSRGLGGRSATRRRDDFRFDHGAPFFMAGDPLFSRHVASWLEEGVVASWRGGFGTLSEVGFEPHTLEFERYVGTPGMSAVARHLGEGLDVLVEHQVRGVHAAGDRWEVVVGDGATTVADVVLLAVPAPQAANLLAGTGSELAARASAVEMSPSWAVLAGFQEPLDLPFDSARVRGGPLAWVARNNSKPDRPPSPEVWVIHASTPWSDDNAEAEPGRVVEELVGAFSELAGFSPPPRVHESAHLWRYARPILPSGDGAWLEESTGLGVCGDWLLGNDLESAFLSGRALAGQLLSSARFQSATRSP